MRAERIRTAARQALTAQSDRRAIAAVNDVVHIWRSAGKLGRQGWRGPGVVLAIAPSRGFFWVTIRGHLLKVSAEQIRRATDEEWRGADIARMLASDVMRDLGKPGSRGYTDVERDEGAPPASEHQPAAAQAEEKAAVLQPLPGRLAVIPEVGVGELRVARPDDSGGGRTRGRPSTASVRRLHGVAARVRTP